ncbi:MAG TPA: hypothetical protein VF540_10290, partial [Segetibacter sp.]
MKVSSFLKNSFSLSVFIGFFQLNIPVVAQTITLEKKWETPSTLKEPESVLYDHANNVLYVSNINNPAAGKDGNGS